jgi:hypothetical protein
MKFKRIIVLFLGVFTLITSTATQANAKAHTWTSGGNCWVCDGGSPNMCTYCHDGACVTSRNNPINSTVNMIFGATPSKRDNSIVENELLNKINMSLPITESVMKQRHK